jgi:hypothetical protein
MGHEWGLHGRTWKMGAWGQNMAPKTLHVLVGIWFGGLSYPNIEMRVKSLVKT